MAEPIVIILPCPFCGYTNINTIYDDYSSEKWGAAECQGCGAIGPEVRTQGDESPDAPWRSEAINEWNRRHDGKGK